LYWELIHVPLIVWSPGRVPAEIRTAEPVSNAAVAATVMNMLGGEAQKIFPGSGLEELWTQADSAKDWSDPLSELAKNDVVGGPDRQASKLEPTATDGKMKSLTTPQWHFIVHEKLGEQLYDWVHDPGETQNLINSPTGQAVVPGLAAEMQKQSAP